MKHNKIISFFDILIYLQNDLLGWIIIIVFDLTGFDGKFHDLTIHWIILVIGIIHITISTLYSIFFYKKGITKHHIQIGKKLLAFNLIMTLLPYLYFAFTSLTA